MIFDKEMDTIDSLKSFFNLVKSRVSGLWYQKEIMYRVASSESGVNLRIAAVFWKQYCGGSVYYINPPILYIFSSRVYVCRKNAGNFIIMYTVLLLCWEV